MTVKRPPKWLLGKIKSTNVWSCEAGCVAHRCADDLEPLEGDCSNRPDGTQAGSSSQTCEHDTTCFYKCKFVFYIFLQSLKMYKACFTIA